MAALFYWLAVSIPNERVNVPQASAADIVSGAVSAVFGILGLICVLVIIGAGFRYVTSQGDSGTVAKAKNAILYAVIGLVVSLFAFAITRFISDAVTGSIPPSSTQFATNYSIVKED